MKKILSIIVGIALAGTMLPSFAVEVVDKVDKCALALDFATIDTTNRDHPQKRPTTTCSIIWDKVVTKNCTIDSTGAITGHVDELGHLDSLNGKTKASTCL